MHQVGITYVPLVPFGLLGRLYGVSLHDPKMHLMKSMHIAI